MHLNDETLLATLVEILRHQRAIMTDLSKLQTSVDANTKAVADVGAEVAALKSADNQTAVDAITAQVDTNNKALTDLLPPPVTAASS
jgi:uncharacterized protein YoxC